MPHFQLLGHDCPLGSYPAPVVPVGRLDGRIVAVYHGSKTPVEPLNEETIYTRHSDAIKETLHGFDYRKERLFALTEDIVFRYSANRETHFFRSLLKLPAFAHQNPFLRLSLSKVINEPAAIADEMRACARQLLMSDTPAFLESWYAVQVEAFSAETNYREFGLPNSWQQLLSPHQDLPQSSRFSLFQDYVAKLLNISGASNVVTNPRVGRKRFDLIFDETVMSGEVVTTCVECKDYSRRVGVSDVRQVINNLAAFRQSRGVEHAYLVARSGFTVGARNMAAEHGIKPLALSDLVERVRQISSIGMVVVERPYSMIGLGPESNMWVHSFEGTSDTAAWERSYASSNYVQSILKGAKSPSGSLVILDLAGIEDDYRPVLDRSFSQRVIEASVRYRDSFHRWHADAIPSVRRTMVINPSKLTSTGLSALRKSLTRHVDIGLEVAILLAGKDASALTSSIVRDVELFSARIMGSVDPDGGLPPLSLAHDQGWLLAMMKERAAWTSQTSGEVRVITSKSQVRQAISWLRSHISMG